jgi:sugar fermentation stimulation protein A
MISGGVYIAVFHLRSEQWLTVGRLGRHRFQPGLYYYVGSAQRGLARRLARHGQPKKALRWHIDYLSVAAPMIGAVTIEASREVECATAALLAERFERWIEGFGATDCRCGGHLFHRPVP